jgi:hypothetical protein
VKEDGTIKLMAVQVNNGAAKGGEGFEGGVPQPLFDI